MELSQVTLGAVLPEEEARFRAVMGTHHYLGAAPKVGETLWYGALWRGEWVALASFSAAALKCQARDAWIGWTLRHKYDRLHLVANNTRFLLLRPVPNLGSRVLGLCARHLVRDWPARFHHPLVLLETFVDPSRFVGTVYRAAGWTEVGMTRGFRRVRGGYRAGSTPKKVFVRALTRHARRVLCTPTLEPRYRHGRPRTMLSAEQMRSLPDVFRTITDPRSRYGRRYRLETLLGLAAAATLCGARGYKAIHEWVCDLSPAMLRHFRCRRCQRRLRATEHLLSAQRDREGGARGARCRAAGLVLGPRSRRRVAGHRRQDHEGSGRRGGPSGPYPRGLRP